MVKLLMIADDFTGAQVDGINFAKRGIDTQIFTGRELRKKDISDTAQVLVVDSETRPLAGDEAYQIVKRITKNAVKLEIPFILKKTDSALRGNVGAELDAVMDGANEKQIYFIPAFPDINRITRKGIHYIDGELLENSAFGKDPFEPVKYSYIPDLLAVQSRSQVISIGKEDEFSKEVTDKQTIYVFDAEKKVEIVNRVKEIAENNRLRLLAGCAGLAECLSSVLDLQVSKGKGIERQKGLYVACGSLNPITKAQVEEAASKGCMRINLSSRQKLDETYYSSLQGREFLKGLSMECKKQPVVIVDTFDDRETEAVELYAEEQGIQKRELRYRISSCHGKIVRYLLEHGMQYTVMMTGGDTLMGFMKEIQCTQLYPVCEIEKGVVLSLLEWEGRRIQIISKSGGFGCRNVIMKIADKVIERDSR